MTGPNQTRTEAPRAEPDVGFSLAAGPGAAPAAAPDPTAAAPWSAAAAPKPVPEAPVPSDPAAECTELSRAIAREIAAAGPAGWHRVEAVFTMTVAAEAAIIVFFDEQERAARAMPSEQLLNLVRAHRERSAQVSDGPWWRYLFALDSAGSLQVDHDFGAEPFPEDQLFPPEAYLADLAAFPRSRIPVWLGAYLHHGDRQSRTPAAARADHLAHRGAPVPEAELPELPLISARWAVLAAVFVAIGSPLGPRILPALNWFAGSTRSGSALFTLPGGRAVLSGGVWEAAALDAVYNGGAEMPAFYRGAPEWVANPVLDPRAATGSLSFCYWWENGRWFRAESPPASEIAPAVPAIWSTESTAGILAALLAEAMGMDATAAATELVIAAETGVVHRDAVRRLLGADERLELEAGLLQLSMAGVVVTGEG
ncbi:hypothetical protein [Nocardia sp. NPDC057353]|uniref:hypothetical protein n=1 Tax=Nocardia sp. NPDC057353 TaxID=3346104 RepID=UPI003624DB26